MQTLAWVGESGRNDVSLISDFTQTWARENGDASDAGQLTYVCNTRCKLEKHIQDCEKRKVMVYGSNHISA